MKLYKSKLWLQNEYTTKTAAQIANEQKVSEQTIVNWLIKHGITQRW